MNKNRLKHRTSKKLTCHTKTKEKGLPKWGGRGLVAEVDLVLGRMDCSLRFRLVSVGENVFFQKNGVTQVDEKHENPGRGECPDVSTR